MDLKSHSIDSEKTIKTLEKDLSDARDATILMTKRNKKLEDEVIRLNKEHEQLNEQIRVMKEAMKTIQP